MARGKASNYVRASYSEVYDMHTEVGKTTLIGIHTPITNRWQSYLGGFCKQFKKFRYKGASLSFVPVTTLPADPLQVSYEAGEPTIDPRDLMNPIIHCGMRGQSMGNYLDEIFRFNISGSLSALDYVNINETEDVGNVNGTLEEAYYTALSAPNFRKSHVQQGFRKSGLHPMVYEISTNRPLNYAGSTGDETLDIGANAYTFSRSSIGVSSPRGSNTDVYGVSDATFSNFPLDVARSFNDDSTKADYPQFFTSRCHSLGWLDTLQRDLIQNTEDNKWSSRSVLTSLPKVYMYFVMLPPAYKTEMYFRVVIRHFFEFQGFRPLSAPFSLWSSNQYPYDGVIENDPATTSEAAVATLDVWNGQAKLMSDGAM